MRTPARGFLGSALLVAGLAPAARPVAAAVHQLSDGQAFSVVRVDPGGRLVAWLYGREGNELWVRIFGALHPVLRRLPPRLVHALAYAFSLPLFLALKLPLPKSPYLASLSRFPFAHLHKIVFDQLLPELTHYYRRAEVEALFAGAGFASVEIHHNRGYSWTVVARR